MILLSRILTTPFHKYICEAIVKPLRVFLYTLLLSKEERMEASRFACSQDTQTLFRRGGGLFVLHAFADFSVSSRVILWTSACFYEDIAFFFVLSFDCKLSPYLIEPPTSPLQMKGGYGGLIFIPLFLFTSP